MARIHPVNFGIVLVKPRWSIRPE